MYGQYPPPMMPYGPGFGSPYMPPNPLGGVKTGAMILGGALVGFLALDLLSTLATLAHVGYGAYQMFFWIRACGYVVVLVGLVMMSRLPRAFGVQLSAWSGFGLFLVALLYSLFTHVSYSSFGFGSGMQAVVWFVYTAAWGCLVPLVMLTAQQTGIRWGAATNAVVASLVGIWRLGVLVLTVMEPDDPYGVPGGRYGGVSYDLMFTGLMLPALGALATLYFLLREIPDGPAFGPPPPPMAPYPGGFAPPPPPMGGGYGPPPPY